MKKIISIILCLALVIPTMSVLSAAASGWGLSLENGMHPEIILERPGSGPYTVSFDIAMKASGSVSPSFILDNGYGNYSPLTISLSGINVMGTQYSYKWGTASETHWHHIDLRFNKGTGYRAGITVTIDGNVICTEEYGDSHTNGYRSDASNIMCWSVLGNVYLDNVVLDGREAGKSWCYTLDFESADYHKTFIKTGTRCAVTVVEEEPEVPDIPDVPDVPDEPDEPDEPAYIPQSSAHPSGNGWYWDENVSYAYIVNYGGNGQDIILDVDMCFVPAIGTPMCTFLTNGASQTHIIKPDSVSSGNKSVPYNWGSISKSNWHHVSYSVIGGKVTIAIDGKDIISNTGFTANTNWQILLNNTGEMMIDNLSLRSPAGKVYFTCDYEDAQFAYNLMGLYEPDPGNGILTPLLVETVEFDLNGGSGDTIGNKYKIKGTGLALPTNVPQKSGYTFLGWAEDKNALAPDYRIGDKYEKESSTVLYAVWLDNSHTHSFGEWKVKKSATCTEAGTEERVCSCGETETRTAAAKGHQSGGRVETTSATCTEASYRTEYCIVCGEIYQKTEISPALGHDFEKTEIAASAEKHGSVVYSCRRCDVTFELNTKAPDGVSAVYAVGTVNESKTQFTVTLNISGNEGLNSLGVELSYNADALKYKSCENGEVFCEKTNGSILVGRTDSVPLKILFDDNEINNNTQNGILATVTFEIEDPDAPFGLSLSYNEKNTVNANGNSVAYATIGDVYTECLYSANTKTESTEQLLGDLDFDGKLTLKDVNIIKQVLLGSKPMVWASDIDSNGKMTLADVSLLIRMVL